MAAADPLFLQRASELLVEARHVVPHTDADGLASGAMALRVRRQTAADAVLLERGQTPFGDTPPIPPGSVALLDWGVRRVNRPALFVDHHFPEAEPQPDQLVISGYGEDLVSTSVLMKRIAPEAPSWLAAVGAVGDYGDVALTLPECRDVPKTAVRKLVPLVNAPRRVRKGPVRLALELLLEHDDPRNVLKDQRVGTLEEARREWRSAFEAAMRSPPIVSDRVALVRFSSPCQVHPLVATAWTRRLAPRIVIAANDNYLPDRVNFAVRGGPDGIDLRRVLKNALPDARGEFAHGHDRATGGSLSFEEFDQLAGALGVRRPTGRTPGS